MRSKRAIYNIMTNLLLQAVTIIGGFIVPKVIIGHFGSDTNGLIASITQFLAYITLLESGFGPVVKAMLYKPIAEKDTRTIAGILRTSEKFFRRIALIFVLYIVILCVFFPLIAKVDFSYIFTAFLVVIIGASTFAEYFFGMAYRLFLRAEQKTYVVSIIQIITYILSVVAIVLLTLSGANVLVVKAVSGLMFILRPIIQNLYVKKKYNISLKGANDKYPIKQKWDGLAQHIASVIHNNTDIVVLTIFTALSEVSVYSVYMLVVNGMKNVIQSFNNGLDSSFGDMIARGENENLRKKFSVYELLYMMITTILFTSAALLITPFIGVYMSGVTDADYVRPIFGYLIVVSEYIWAIRLPYNSITMAAGHFRETRIGAWIEAGVNIVLSIILVFNFGIVGVAIGTIIAMTIRTIEFIYHANRYILKRSVWESVRKIIISAAVFIVATVIFYLLNTPMPNGYGGWVINAAMLTSAIGAVTILVFCIVFRRDMGAVLMRVKDLFRRKK